MRQVQRFSYAMAITYPNDPNMVSKGCKNAFDSINIVKVVLCCANVSSGNENEGGFGIYWSHLGMKIVGARNESE